MHVPTQWIVALGVAAALAVTGCRGTSAEQVATRVRGAVARQPPRYAQATWTEIQRIYRERDFRPIWLTADGRPATRAADFTAALCRAERQGLRRGAYNLAGLYGALERAYGGRRPDADELAEVDLRLTALFIEYGRHLLAGRLDAGTADTTWYIRRRRAAADSIVGAAIGAATFAEMLAPLEPAQPEYRGLVEALAEYREIVARGGWPRVPGGGVLRSGDRGPRVEALRARLAATGDVGGRPARDPAVYDRGLSEAVASFQERHGIEPDGQVGAATLAALNVPVETRIQQIELNLERYRWLPHTFGQRYLLVNIPDFRLYAYDGGRQRFSMGVTLGADYRHRAPVFADSLSHLVFQPVWEVPSGIVRSEIAPRARADASFLEAHRFVALGGERGAARLDHAAVDWAAVDTAGLAVRVRQLPAPSNPLGRIAYRFPNRFDLYIHGTPDRPLFPDEARASTAGCLAVQEPVRLAEFALAGTAEWDAGDIRQAMQSNDSTAVDRRVALERKVPVYIVYLTAFVRDGRVQFRTDPYRLDERALTQLGPASGAGMICTQLERLLRG